MAGIKEKTAAELQSYQFWKDHRENPNKTHDLFTKHFGGGFLSKPLMWLNDRVQEKTRQDISEMWRYEPWEKIARAILAKSNVRDTLRNAFLDFGRQNVVMEKDVIAIVVDTLCREEFVNDKSIASDPIVYAIIVDDIIRTGINEFCAPDQTNG